SRGAALRGVRIGARCDPRAHRARAHCRRCLASRSRDAYACEDRPVRRRGILLASIAGLVWGVLATVLFLAMFRGLAPAVSELPMPLSVLAYAVILPFQGALAIEALLGHSSPGLAEIVGLTLACGILLGVAALMTVVAVREVPASGG